MYKADLSSGNSTSNSPFCQSFTFPEDRAIAYGCGTKADTAWRTVSLTFSTSFTLPNISQSKNSSTLTLFPSTTNLIPMIMASSGQTQIPTTQEPNSISSSIQGTPSLSSTTPGNQNANHIFRSNNWRESRHRSGM
jgi:hypothetical protein